MTMKMKAIVTPTPILQKRLYKQYKKQKKLFQISDFLHYDSEEQEEKE